jgi:hypothetical protein
LPPTLAAPEMAPRQNRAALLRLGQVPASQGRNPRDVAEQAVLNKEREAAERLAKRKSVALPASLAAPSIAPRQNRASMLRTGPPMFSDSTARPAPSPAPPAAAQPVRENRASQLRAGTGKPPAAPSARHAASASMSFAAPRAAPPPPAGRHRAAASVSSTRSTASSAAATASSTTASASTEAKADRRTSIFGRLGRTSTTPRTVPEPRPTRSSLLREGLGAKIGKARA